MIRSVLFFQDFSSMDIEQENSKELKEKKILNTPLDSVTGICGLSGNILFHLIEGDMDFIDGLIIKENSNSASPSIEIVFDHHWGRRAFSSWRVYQTNQQSIRDNGLNNFLIANFDKMHTLSDVKFEILTDFIKEFFK